MPADYKDLVIETLADDEAALLERLASLENDIRIYRELAQQALHELHHLTRRHDRLREQHARLLDEFRFLRAQTMRRSVAA